MPFVKRENGRTRGSDLIKPTVTSGRATWQGAEGRLQPIARKEFRASTQLNSAINHVNLKLDPSLVEPSD